MIVASRAPMRDIAWGTLEMDASEILQSLIGLRRPDREIDVMIARWLGWVRTPTIERQPDGTVARRVAWFRPGENTPSPIPYFSDNIDDARYLATLLDPDHAAAISWHTNYCQAVVNDYPAVRAPNCAIALCIACLREHLSPTR